MFLAVCTAESHAASRRRALVDNLRFGPGVANHPVGVAPSANIRIPEGWPLEFDGTIGCKTCHTQLPSMSGGDAHLRPVDGEPVQQRTFCSTCHQQRGVRDASGLHWMAVGSAHVKRRQDNRFGGRMDSESRRCLSCHDGVSASNAVNGTRGGGSFFALHKNHPIGVDYPPRHEPGTSAYRHPTSLPETVRIPDGKVSCVSCHDLYAHRKNLLTVTTDNSALCFTCHAMN